MAYNYNPTYPQYGNYSFQANQQMPQRYSITRVNGENGARSFQMLPNSEALLLDTTQPIIWLAQTDGAGYLSVTPFDIKQHEELPPVDIRNLEQRLTRLEGMLNGQSNRPENSTNNE